MTMAMAKAMTMTMTMTFDTCDLSREASEAKRCQAKASKAMQSQAGPSRGGAGGNTLATKPCKAKPGPAARGQVETQSRKYSLTPDG